MIDVYDLIKSKPKGFDTVVDETFTRAEIFLIGLARALLTDCETLLIYEIPNSLTQKDKDKIASTLWQLSRSKTIIFFTHTDLYRDIAKTTYYIENGKVAKVEINNHSSFCLLQEMSNDVPEQKSIEVSNKEIKIQNDIVEKSDKKLSTKTATKLKPKATNTKTKQTARTTADKKKTASKEKVADKKNTTKSGTKKQTTKKTNTTTKKSSTKKPTAK